MYHLHTPSKHGRTVVIFIKKIWAQINAFWAFGSAHLELSFGQSKAPPARSLGFWLPGEEAYLELDADIISLVCRPACGLGPRCSFYGTKKPLVLAVTKLEALVPVISNICKINQALKSSKIVIINLSQMSSNPEQEGSLGEHKALEVHNQVFKQVLVEIHKLGSDLGLEILLFEQKELLSNKNSALFERLFMSK